MAVYGQNFMAANSDFMQDFFGERAAEAEVALVDIARSAHRKSVLAHEAAESDTNDVFGTSFWGALHRHSIARMCDAVPGATLTKLTGFRYQLVTWKNQLIVPVKIKDIVDLQPGTIRVGASDFRRHLGDLGAPLFVEVDLFDDAQELESEQVAMQRARDRAELAQSLLNTNASGVVFVAVLASVTGGVRLIHVGEGKLDQDGFIVWGPSETLNLRAEVTQNPGLVTASTSFADTPTPMPALSCAQGQDERGRQMMQDSRTAVGRA
ncbi:hypothetical protein [Nocardioides alcanivorans]|uniref:hypothetical protein n=1 Tax=Nocardioides alcanivorans TaxID=2897352 RepID=UPI001F1CE120|nr:hypothetical protein [Nocardioides alcanivorans]